MMDEFLDDFAESWRFMYVFGQILALFLAVFLFVPLALWAGAPWFAPLICAVAFPPVMLGVTVLAFGLGAVAEWIVDRWV